jgi:transcriptional regulator with XRE-family HTH domain
MDHSGRFSPMKHLTREKEVLIQDERNRASRSQADSAMGASLTSIRLRTRLTQNDLAKKIGVSRQHISNIETGMTSPTVRVLQNYLQACGTNLAEFFYGPLPVNETLQQREYHYKLQALLQDSATNPVVTKVLDSFMTSLNISAKAAVQPVRVQARAARVRQKKIKHSR